MPHYATEEEWAETTWLTYFYRVIFGAIMLVVGYQFGTWDSRDEDLKNHKVIEFETEEQIFDFLYNQKKRAVFLQFYTPGHMINNRFNRVFEQESSKYTNKEDPEDDIVFMRV